LDDLVNTFIEDGIYKLKNFKESIFVCSSSSSDHIGKLTQYIKDGNIYEKTNITYFLNCYLTDDLKELFLKRENYDMIGKIGVNFDYYDDKHYIMRKENER